jgi:biopolymer transport protein ExbD/biopolymer transport protein TolR
MQTQRGKRGALHKAVKPRPAAGVMAEINVTPLVDVVLVLLIIFMVVTPMLSRGKDVQLPTASNTEKKQDTGNQIIVSLDSAASVYVETTKVDMDLLKGKVEEELKKNPGKDLFFKGDKRVKYKHAREALEAIHQAGAVNVQLGTEEEKK